MLVWSVQAGGAAEPRRLVNRPQLGQVLAFGNDVLALVGDGGTVEIRDAHSGTLRRTLPGRGGDVTSLAFAPNGRTLAIARFKSPALLWDANTGDELVELENVKYGESLDFSADGQRLAAATGESVLLWDVAAGKLIAEEMAGAIQSARFLTDGSALVQIVSGGSVTVCTTDKFDRAQHEARAGTSGVAVEGRPLVKSAETVVPGRHLTTIWGLAASPDGKWLATASHNGEVVLWDAATGQRSRTLAGHRDLAWGIAFSPDSRLLASSSDDVKIWDVATGDERTRFTGHDRLVVALAFHPTRPWVISGCYDGTVRLWDLNTGRALGVLYRVERSGQRRRDPARRPMDSRLLLRRSRAALEPGPDTVVPRAAGSRARSPRRGSVVGRFRRRRANPRRRLRARGHRPLGLLNVRPPDNTPRRHGPDSQRLLQLGRWPARRLRLRCPDDRLEPCWRPQDPARNEPRLASLTRRSRRTTARGFACRRGTCLQFFCTHCPCQPDANTLRTTAAVIENP